MRMYCGNCGKEIESEHTFCGHCGFKTTHGKSDPVFEGIYFREKSKRSGCLTTILVVLGGFVGILIGLFIGALVESFGVLAYGSVFGALIGFFVGGFVTLKWV